MVVPRPLKSTQWRPRRAAIASRTKGCADRRPPRGSLRRGRWNPTGDGPAIGNEDTGPVTTGELVVPVEAGRGPRRFEARRPLGGVVVAGAGEVGGGEVGVGHEGAGEVGVVEVGAGEVGAGEVGPGEVGAVEVGVAEVGVVERDTREERAHEMGVGEVRADEAGPG